MSYDWDTDWENSFHDSMIAVSMIAGGVAYKRATQRQRTI